MTMRIKGVFAAAVLCGVCLAQETTQAPAPSASAPPTSASQQIAPGSVIPVQLTRSIDAKKIKPGDPVEAKVTQDLKTGNGQIIVPKDTKIVGRITEAQARSKEQKESQVGIAFDHAVMKSGGDVQLPMSIQAIIAPAGLNSNNSSNNNGGNSESANQSPSPSSSTPNGGMSGNTDGRSGGMGAGAPASASDSAGGNSPGEAQGRGSAQPQITGNTQGVIGISNLKLSAEPNSAQGSMVSSEKNNVKLDSGTLLLLRVNQ